MKPIIPTLCVIALSQTSFAAAEPAQQARMLDSAATRPRDLSVLTMFINADVVVKVIMIGLLLASVSAWAILIAKTIELRRARQRVLGEIEKLSNARGLAEARLALGNGDPLTRTLLTEATREMRLSSDILSVSGVRERISSSFGEIQRAHAIAIKRGTGVLASIGSTGPFIGLFGTVWGIMNSFIGISKTQTTNLAVVAPGIAEALLATAVGLFAAIPAVLIYNHLAREAGAYLELVSNVSGELLRIVSRDLERSSHVPTNVHAAE